MKTSKKDFQIFKRSVEKWIAEFGLKNWDISIVHEDAEGSDEISGVAWFSAGPYGHQVGIIGLCENYSGLTLTTSDIKRFGFHEVCHILLYQLSFLMSNRFGVIREDCEKEIHSLITVLENTLWRSSKS